VTEPSATGPSATGPSAAQRWREALDAWRIPESVLRSAEDEPWVLPREVFARRARRRREAPEGPSFELAWAALQPPGSVLDVGAGAGAACLPLAGRCTEITAIDPHEGLLADLAAGAAEVGVECRTVLGSWPEAAAGVEPADVVLCHHVLYNVADLAPFAVSLERHARRLVVVELTQRHPIAQLNDLWRRFHGIDRPEGPTADDAVAVLRELGIEPRVRRWARPPTADHPSFEALVDVTRRRLCLPRARHNEVARALTELGHGPNKVPDLGTSWRKLVTLSWQPTER
jgi:SAM-dependent methyltransferase